MSQEWTTDAFADWGASLNDDQMPADVDEITEERSYG